jgi:hypothetical protein
MLLFTVREAFQESLGFSILYYVEYFRHKFTRACEIEQDNLKQSQDKMKHWYENKVIVVLLIHYHSLQAK